MDDKKQTQDFLQHYDLLKSTGVLEEIRRLIKKNRDLEGLLDQAARIFYQQTIPEKAKYIIELLLNRFTPSFLSFIIQEEFSSDKPLVLSYQNLQLVPNFIDIPTMAPYKQFFSLSPVTVAFNVFEYMIGNPVLTDIFLPLNPEKMIPIMGFDGLHGFVVVGKKILGDSYTEDETEYLDRLIQLVSISFQNTIHYRQAVTDSKTKLYNHSFFLLRLEEEFNRIKRYKGELCLLMIDVDHFKLFNDTHGHVAGDQALSQLGIVIRDSIRQGGDIPSRFGGEEFAVLLIQCPIDGALVTAERIRTSLEKTIIRYFDKELSITASFGIAYAGHDHMPLDVKDFIQQADKALYASKKAGRNRTTIYTKDIVSIS